MGVKEIIARELEGVRRRSLGMLEPVPDSELLKQHSPLMSPLVWDLAHVGNYEEIWLLRTIAGIPANAPALDEIYDAFRHARKERGRLELLGPTQARTYISDIRDKVFEVLDEIELDPSNPLLNEGFVYGMAIQHEHQHDETMLATLQLRGEYPLNVAPPPAGAPLSSKEAFVEAGSFTMGTDTEPWAFDNERPAHTVDLPAFFIDTAPVSNADYAQFIETGGYHDRRFWSPEGWVWREQEGLETPLFWKRQGTSSWSRTRFGKEEPLPEDQPVQHVCWHEAEAYAAWVGKRLPSEAEWEKAASWDAKTSTKRRYPWGDQDPSEELANLNERHFEPAGIGAYPKGTSPYGCHQMIGDVWEWTSSDFNAHPGFVTFPYREYSEVFFGRDYKVLKGGSWATHPTAIRPTFRNWDYPIRRQIFCGFRCARDA